MAAASGTWWLRSEGSAAVVGIGSDFEVRGDAPTTRVGAVGGGAVRERRAPITRSSRSLHADASGCGGHMGYAQAGQVDVCTVLANEMALGTCSTRWGTCGSTRTSRLRCAMSSSSSGLRAWNASSDPWDKRGYEQGAEIMANAGSKTVAVCRTASNRG